MHPLEKTVLSNLRKRRLASIGDKGIVAVSGGADSLALLHLLHALKDKLALTLEVLHFNHGLRDESAGEAEWVAERAAMLGLPFHLRTTNHLSEFGGGVQEAARDWRREQGGQLRRRIGASWVATGHHLDDQSETIMLKLMRGSHLANLRGMAWRSGGIVRPLLNIPHAGLTSYLSDRRMKWLEDPSNQDSAYKRNRVRNELLPLMNDISGGGIVSRLNDLAAQSEALRTLLDELPQPEQSSPDGANHWIAADQLRPLPEFAAATLLHRFVAGRMPGALDSVTLRKAVLLLRSHRTTWTLHLSNGRTLRQAGERLILELREEPQEEMSALEGPGWQIEFSAGMEPRVCEGPCGAKDAMLLHNLPAGACLRVRTRRRGDRFHPGWRDSPVKVKDFLRDQHVPLWRRERLPCVVLDGLVIAIYPGFVGRGFESPETEAPKIEPAGFCLHLPAP